MDPTLAALILACDLNSARFANADVHCELKRLLTNDRSP